MVKHGIWLDTIGLSGKRLLKDTSLKSVKRRLVSSS